MDTEQVSLPFFGCCESVTTTAAGATAALAVGIAASFRLPASVQTTRIVQLMNHSQL